MRNAPDDIDTAGPLSALETDTAWYVVWHGDPGDWLAEFKKSAEADAEGWARNMAQTYNRRVTWSAKAHRPPAN